MACANNDIISAVDLGADPARCLTPGSLLSRSRLHCADPAAATPWMLTRLCAALVLALAHLFHSLSQFFILIAERTVHYQHVGDLPVSQGRTLTVSETQKRGKGLSRNKKWRLEKADGRKWSLSSEGHLHSVVKMEVFLPWSSL